MTSGRSGCLSPSIDAVLRPDGHRVRVDGSNDVYARNVAAIGQRAGVGDDPAVAVVRPRALAEAAVGIKGPGANPTDAGIPADDFRAAADHALLSLHRELADQVTAVGGPIARAPHGNAGLARAFRGPIAHHPLQALQADVMGGLAAERSRACCRSANGRRVSRAPCRRSGLCLHAFGNRRHLGEQVHQRNVVGHQAPRSDAEPKLGRLVRSEKLGEGRFDVLAAHDALAAGPDKLAVGRPASRQALGVAPIEVLFQRGNRLGESPLPGTSRWRFSAARATRTAVRTRMMGRSMKWRGMRYSPTRNRNGSTPSESIACSIIAYRTERLFGNRASRTRSQRERGVSGSPPPRTPPQTGLSCLFCGAA